MNNILEENLPELYHIENGEIVAGQNPLMTGDPEIDLYGNCSNLMGSCAGKHGDCSNINEEMDENLIVDFTGLCGEVTGKTGSPIGLKGNWSKITGDISGLTGDCSNLEGDASGINGCCGCKSGNIDNCELSQEDRDAGIDINTLLVSTAMGHTNPPILGKP